MWQKKIVFFAMIMTSILLCSSCISQHKNAEGEQQSSLEDVALESRDTHDIDGVKKSDTALETENTGYTLDSIEMDKGEGYDVFVYIDAYVPEDNTLLFNVVEWVDTPERAAEIGIDYERDMPSGFYIYDEVVVSDALPLEEDYCYTMLNETTPMTVEHQALYTFIDYMHEEGFAYPFKIRILNQEITKVEQVYMP